MNKIGQNYQGIIKKYIDRLPIDPNAEVISLSEGNTPLIRLRNLPKKLGIKLDIYVKFEGLNPTGSFKDRGMTVAITQAYAEGNRAVICASTGNTSASAAAYAASCGMRAFVLIPEGKIAMGKLAQAMMHGASIIQIEGNFDDGMQIVKDVAKQVPVSIVNSINPFRIQGQKTAAFEIVEQLSNAPDYHCLPVGNAGNITAYWMGYSEYFQSGDSTARPKMLGYQASGAAPIVTGERVDSPETIATAIRIGDPQSWQPALNAQQASSGWFAACDDEAILQAQYYLASAEGIFCEPASAISIAGLIKDCRDGKIASGSTVVCTLTGHGLKDPDVAIKQCNQNALITVPATTAAIKTIIEKNL